jgi:AbiV family abortive infection protein
MVTAAILFTFAVEEFGKAVLLREAFDKATSPVTVVGFYNHWRKIEAAGRHIREEQLLLHRGAFQRGVFAKGFDLGNLADVDARLDGLYVDWRNDAWVVGVRVDPAVLNANIAAVGEILARQRATWGIVQ